MRQIDPTFLSYTVFIKWNNGFNGSGFFLRAKNKLYLVTAKHVLFSEQNIPHGTNIELICQPDPRIGDSSNIVLSLDMNKLLTKGNITPHLDSDVACILIGDTKVLSDNNFKINYKDGVLCIASPDNRLVLAMDNHTRKFEDVFIGNDVIIQGFPTSIGLDGPPQFDPSKPLLRKGAIAGVNKTNKTIILDCPVFYGNSGGPVVQVDIDLVNTPLPIFNYNHSIIGVVTQFIPYEETWKNLKNNLENKEWFNSGYSVAVSIDKVFEIL